MPAVEETVRPSDVPSAPAMVAGAVQRVRPRVIRSHSMPLGQIAQGRASAFEKSVDELGMQWQSARGWVVIRPPQCHPNPCSLEQGVQVTQVEASWTSIRRVRTSVQETIDIAYRDGAYARGSTSGHRSSKGGDSWYARSLGTTLTAPKGVFGHRPWSHPSICRSTGRAPDMVSPLRSNK